MWESHKRERDELRRALRARGATWVEVAEAFRSQYGLNCRVAFRLAHGWSQHRAAEEWNAHWPDEPKTHKNFSYWEQWPARTGHAPSLDVLARLAKIYCCRVSDLLTDVADHRPDDNANKALLETRDTASTPMTDVVVPTKAEILFQDIMGLRGSFPSTQTALVEQVPDVDFDELARLISMWAQQWNISVGRRDLLLKMGTALTVAAASPIFDFTEDDEHERVSRFMRDPSDFDTAALQYCEGMITNLRKQGDVLGPRLTLQSAMGHRDLASRLARLAPEPYRKRVISAYAELTQLMGWLSFNLGDYRSAQQYYDEARTSAHDAENVELVTYVLCTMSHLATWQGKPRVGIDHAAAAAVWAEQAGSHLARAYAADVAVRAYLADKQQNKCRLLLEAEHKHVAKSGKGSPSATWWYFYDESFYWATATQVELGFKEPEEAILAAEKSLELVDPSNLHERAHRSLHRADALIQQDNIGEACSLIGQVAGITAISSSRRVEQRLGGLRTALEPWSRTKSVRDLDEMLRSYRSTSIGSGK